MTNYRKLGEKEMNAVNSHELSHLVAKAGAEQEGEKKKGGGGGKGDKGGRGTICNIYNTLIWH